MKENQKMENDKKHEEPLTETCSDESTAQASDGSATPPDDKFDIESCRLSQNYENLIDVKKIITTVPIKKPDKQWFVRVHPDWQFETAVLEDKEDMATYLVVPTLWVELSHEITRKVLFAAITTHKVLFLWPVKLPGDDGRTDHWNESAREAARLAKKNWIRICSNRALGAYEVIKAAGALHEPEWPQEMDFNELVKIAFKGRIIKEWEHPVLKRLRGE
jgi:hypothetical protein